MAFVSSPHRSFSRARRRRGSAASDGPCSVTSSHKTSRARSTLHPYLPLSPAEVDTRAYGERHALAGWYLADRPRSHHHPLLVRAVLEPPQLGPLRVLRHRRPGAREVVASRLIEVVWEERAVVIEHHHAASHPDTSRQVHTRAAGPTRGAAAGGAQGRRVVETLGRARLAIDDRVAQLRQRRAPFTLAHAAMFRIAQPHGEGAREQLTQERRVERPEG